MPSSSHPTKIAHRAMLHWQRGATIPELTDYFVHALPQPALLQQLLLASPALLLPLQIALQQAIVIREQQIATKALRQLEATQKTLIPTIDDKQLLRDMVEQCRSDGSLTRWLARLSPQTGCNCVAKIKRYCLNSAANSQLLSRGI